ncbi:MAG: spore coat protein [Syntrophomonadaceae bacterium]|nr:spore coat protein [Syntrophomonadaceae bacterium]
MQDKEMANDILSMINGSLSSYAGMIAQTANQQLRTTLQQTRNGDEQFQYQLFQLAAQKGYYQPAGPAEPSQVQSVRHQLGV